jgi:hypothetical protein
MFLVVYLHKYYAKCGWFCAMKIKVTKMQPHSVVSKSGKMSVREFRTCAVCCKLLHSHRIWKLTLCISRFALDNHSTRKKTSCHYSFGVFLSAADKALGQRSSSSYPLSQSLGNKCYNIYPTVEPTYKILLKAKISLYQPLKLNWCRLVCVIFVFACQWPT